MEIIANDLPRFLGDIGDYENAFSSFRTHFEQLNEDMAALNSMWEGEAHDALVASYEKDKARLQELSNLLEQIMNEMKFAHEEYSRCENNVSQTIDSINI